MAFSSRPSRHASRPIPGQLASSAGFAIPSSANLVSTVVEALSSSTGSSLLSGGIAGCVAKTAVSPLARLTVLAQTATLRGQGVEPRSVRVEALRICRVEGVRAFWRGNACTCLHRFPLTGIQFSVFDACQRGGASPLCGGALACAIAVTFCYPLDIIRTRMMTQTVGTRPGVRVLFWELWASGRAGLYRGLGPSVAASLPPVAISFATYTPAKQQLVARGFSEKSPAVFVLGGFSGIIGSSLVFPLDLLRRRLQIMGSDPSVLRESSLLQEARHVVKQEGWKGLWRGLGPEIMKVFPSAGIMFLVFEQLKTLPNVFRLVANVE